MGELSKTLTSEIMINWKEITQEGKNTKQIIGIPDEQKLLPVLLEQLNDGSWIVMRIVNKYGFCSSPMVNCKTKSSAKRWVSRYYLPHNRQSAEAKGKV